MSEVNERGRKFLKRARKDQADRSARASDFFSDAPLERTLKARAATHNGELVPSRKQVATAAAAAARPAPDKSTQSTNFNKCQ